jgi:hypothetical protein
MKHRNSHFAVGYWSRLRRGRAVPDQADIDPKALKRLLPFVFILESRADGTFIYRLAGTTLCERYGAELRGRNFLSHWDTEGRGRLHVLMRQALAARAPLCVHSIGATEDCRMVELETVLMPVSFGGTEPVRFLGIAQILTDVAPLIGRSISFERLVASYVVREGESHRDIEFPPPPPPPIQGEQKRPRRRAHLRLVVSQRTEAGPDPLSTTANEAMEKILVFCGTRASGIKTPA